MSEDIERSIILLHSNDVLHDNSRPSSNASIQF